MNLEFVDIKALSIVQDSISEIIDIPFSTYDVTGTLLIPSKKEDPIIEQIKSYASDKEEYNKFIRNSAENAAIRSDISVFQGIANQYHLFIPINVNGFKLLFISGSFYNAKSEFEDFFMKNGRNFGFSASSLQSWSEKNKIKDLQSVQKIALHIKSLYETILFNSYEKTLVNKRFQWIKTMLDVLFHTNSSSTKEELYSLLIDSVLFLFNVETASVIVNKGNYFKAAITSGKLSADVSDLSIEADNPLLSRSLKDFTFTSTNNIFEISKLGLPDSIKSMHLFPLSDNYGLLVIYNSPISKEETYGILELCKLASLVLRNPHLRILHNKFVDNIKNLNNSILKLTHDIHHMDMLYDTVVDTATELLNAEKGSVMIPDEENKLMIKAIKGLSKWLIQDIRLQIGEGIAGNVFKEGKPFLVENMEKLQLPYIKSKKHYKTSSFISVPLKLDSEVFGVLNIADKKTGEDFTENDLTLLKYFSVSASIAIKMSDYYNMAGKLKELSITDPLTGLFNRRYFYDRLSEEIHRSERYNFVFSLAIFDIDDFKLFNDTEGHLAGDEVLKELARIAHRSLRSNDIISRFGGEEFIVLMPQTDKEEAFIVAERMRKNIKESFTRTWEKFLHPTITVSIGISSFPEDGKDSENLIKNADLVLYKAKAEGKNKTVISSLYKRL